MITSEDVWRSHYPFPTVGYGKDEVTDSFRRYPIAEALDHRFIPANAHRFVTQIVLDIDVEDAERHVMSKAWDDGLPEPEVIITNNATGHAHITFPLAFGIPVSERAAPAPLAFLSDIRLALVDAFEADRGYSGGEMRSPFGPDVTTRFVREQPNTLAELKALLPARTIRRTKGLEAYRGTGSRHQEMFAAGAAYAHRHHEDVLSSSALSFAVFNHLRDEMALYALLNGCSKLPDSDLRSIARSTSTWTWRHLHNDKARASLAHRNSQARVKFGLNNTAKIETLVRENPTMTRTQIASTTGLSTRTISRRRLTGKERAQWEADGRARQDTALALFDGGKSYREIAKIMNLSYNQVRGLIVRARERAL